MKKLLILIAVLVLIATSTSVAYAGTNSKVAYTWTVADLGQGAWGGGPLFADGSAGGHIAISLLNGQLIFLLEPTTWSVVEGGTAVDVCFNLHEIKGDSGYPPSYCLSDEGVVVPISGTPIIVPVPESPSSYTLFRVTPAN